MQNARINFILAVGVRIGEVLVHCLGFEGGEAGGVVDGGVDAVFDAGFFFGLFGVVPAAQGSDEVAGDAAETFELTVVKIFGVGGKILFGGRFGTKFRD